MHHGAGAYPRMHEPARFPFLRPQCRRFRASTVNCIEISQSVWVGPVCARMFTAPTQHSNRRHSPATIATPPPPWHRHCHPANTTAPPTHAHQPPNRHHNRRAIHPHRQPPSRQPPPSASATPLHRPDSAPHLHRLSAKHRHPNQPASPCTALQISVGQADLCITEEGEGRKKAILRLGQRWRNHGLACPALWPAEPPPPIRAGRLQPPGSGGPNMAAAARRGGPSPPWPVCVCVCVCVCV
jgi:hypothetical protein